MLFPCVKREYYKRQWVHVQDTCKFLKKFTWLGIANDFTAISLLTGCDLKASPITFLASVEWGDWIRSALVVYDIILWYLLCDLRRYINPSPEVFLMCHVPTPDRFYFCNACWHQGGLYRLRIPMLHGSSVDGAWQRHTAFLVLLRTRTVELWDVRCVVAFFLFWRKEKILASMSFQYWNRLLPRVLNVTGLLGEWLFRHLLFTLFFYKVVFSDPFCIYDALYIAS